MRLGPEPLASDQPRDHPDLLGGWIKPVHALEYALPLDAKRRRARSAPLAEDAFRLAHGSQRLPVAGFYPLPISCDAVIATP